MIPCEPTTAVPTRAENEFRHRICICESVRGSYPNRNLSKTREQMTQAVVAAMGLFVVFIEAYKQTKIKKLA